MSAATKQELPEIRARMDAAAAEAQLDAFVERNRDMLEKSVEEGRALLAKGAFRKGTAADLVAEIVEKSRRRPAAD